MKVQRLVRLSILLVGILVVWGALAPGALAVVGFRAAEQNAISTLGSAITYVSAASAAVRTTCPTSTMRHNRTPRAYSC